MLKRAKRYLLLPLWWVSLTCVKIIGLSGEPRFQETFQRMSDAWAASGEKYEDEDEEEEQFVIQCECPELVDDFTQYLDLRVKEALDGGLCAEAALRALCRVAVTRFQLHQVGAVMNYEADMAFEDGKPVSEGMTYVAAPKRYH